MKDGGRGNREKEGRGVQMARCHVLRPAPKGIVQRHALFKGVIQSVTLDAKSFVTL